MAERPTYSREEMDAILERALERQRLRADGIGHDDLVAAAEEVGIPREDVEAAARDFAKRRAAAPASGEGAVETAVDAAVVRRDDLRKLAGQVLSWLVGSVFFYVICAFTGQSWWVWPVAGWGLGVALKVVRVLLGGGGKSETRRERRERRRKEKLADFEKRVAMGTEAVVNVIEGIRAVQPPKRRVAVDEAPSGPRVEVSPEEPGEEVDALEDDSSEEGRRAGRKVR